MFRFSSQDTVSNKSKAVILRIHTTSNQSIPFTMSYHLSQIDDTASILYAFLLVCGLYILIIFEVSLLKFVLKRLATLSTDVK